MANPRMAFDGESLRSRLKQYDRTPFHDLLAMFLENAPTADEIAAFAKRYPDKWVAALVQIARTAGYTDKTESTVNVNINVSQMSDSQLEDAIRARAIALEMPLPDTIDAEYEELPLGDTDLAAGETGPAPDAMCPDD